MHCTKCGHDNIEGATYCAQCGTPFAGGPSKDEASNSGNRKVVKLTTDGAEENIPTIDRPWEVRVPKYNASTPGSTGKVPPTHKRAGSSGKVPAIKRPASSEAEEIPSAKPGKAVAGASIGGAAGKTADFSPVDSSKNPGGRDHTPVPRKVQKETKPDIAIGDKGGKGKKIGAIIAILFICVIAVAIALFLLNGKSDKLVTFETNGGTSIAQREIIDGGKLSQPANPVREGYTFEGWFFDPDYTEPASFPISVTENMTLYAKWKAKDNAATSTSASSSTASAPTDGNANADGTANNTSGNTENSAAGAAANTGTGTSGTASGESGNATNGGSGGSGASGGSGNSNNSGNSGNSGNGSDTGNSSATVSVIAQNGEKLSGTVHLKDGYVIPNSSTKAYTIKELRALKLNDAELCIARNEPYARMGYSFRNPGLQAYFNARSWYHNKGWRGELPTDSAGYITAHNLLTIAQENKDASKWLRLRTS